MPEIKPYLIEKSEALVDLMEALEQAVEQNDEAKSTEIVKKLNDMGNELVELVINLKGDDQAYVNFMLGSLCSSLRMWPEAEDAYLQALKVWPDHVGILNELFAAQFELTKYDSAVETIKKSLEIGGETPDVLHNLAAATWQTGKKAEAKIIVMNAMAKYPQSHSFYELLNDMDQA
ncbi:hypothetical protein EP331_05790 [bacterium]|nr:MAG: hypothetical protein EP331_05790 [bacterium]